MQKLTASMRRNFQSRLSLLQKSVTAEYRCATNIIKQTSRNKPKIFYQTARFFDVDKDRTKLFFLNEDTDDRLLIDGYTQIGFTLNVGFGVWGPMAIFPRTALSWSVQKWEEVNAASLSLFLLLQPTLDVLVLGSGNTKQNLLTDLKQLLQKQKIHVEVLPTDQACGVFNFLNAEQRFVGAGLLPMTTARPTLDERAFQDMRSKQKLLDENY